MQVCVAGEQNGVTPPQSPSPRHPAQVPPPVAVSQRGLSAEQRETSVGVQAAHKPSGRQIGVAAPQSELEAQPRQVELAESQMGLLPVHPEASLAEHWTQAPVAEQTGAVDEQSEAAAQARQARVVASQMGVVPPQSVLDLQLTHAPAVVSQIAVAPEHAVSFVAEHASHAPLG